MVGFDSAPGPIYHLPSPEPLCRVFTPMTSVSGFAMRRSFLRRILFDRDTLGLMGFGLMVKPVGLVTQVLIARWFGAGEQVDAFQLSLFLVTFGDGTLARIFKGALSPHLIKYKQQMDTHLYARYQNGIVGGFLLGGAVWLTLLTVLVGTLIHVIWPDLPEKTAGLTVRMELVMVVPALVMISNNLHVVVLNLHQHFQVAGAMPVLNAICMLFALVFWHDSLGIWSLPAGFALSQLLRAPIIHGRALVSGAVKPARPMLAREDLGVIRELVTMMAISEVLLTINLFLDKWFATGLEPGSIASLHYAYIITNTVVVLFLTSLVTVMFPRMSAAIAAGDFNGCSKDIRANLKRAAHIVVPAAVMITVASPQIVHVLFQRGEFDAADAARTSGAMAMYALGLPALVLNAVVARVFHSLQLLRDKVWLSVQYLLTNALLNAALVGILQVRGLALASTAAIGTHLALSLWILHRRQTGLTTGRFAGIIGEAFVLGMAAYGVYWLLPVDEMVARMGVGTMWTSLLIGMGKGAVIAVCYLVLWLGLRWWHRRGRA